MRGMKIQREYPDGFTLVELLVVISIISVLSAVVMAGLTSARAKGQTAAGQTFDGHTYAAFNNDRIIDWDFESSSNDYVRDVSGNGNDLKLDDVAMLVTPPSPSPTGNGKALAIDLPNSRTAHMLSPVNGIGTTQSFTVSLWIYPTDSKAVEFISDTWAIGAGKWRIGIFSLNAPFSYSAFSSASQQKSSQGGQLAVNAWTHIAAVCNQNKLGVYMNGRLVEGSVQTYTSGTCQLSPSAVYLNGFSLGGGSYLYYVDNVRVYKQALPVAVIRSIYETGLANLIQVRPVAYGR